MHVRESPSFFDFACGIKRGRYPLYFPFYLFLPDHQNDRLERTRECSIVCLPFLFFFPILYWNRDLFCLSFLLEYLVFTIMTYLLSV